MHVYNMCVCSVSLFYTHALGTHCGSVVNLSAILVTSKAAVSRSVKRIVWSK